MYPNEHLFAFTDSGLSIPIEMHVKQVLSFGWPCEYRLDESFITRLRENAEHRLTIDIGGRNHGVREAVYVDTTLVVDYLDRLGIA